MATARGVEEEPERETKKTAARGNEQSRSPRAEIISEGREVSPGPQAAGRSSRTKTGLTV